MGRRHELALLEDRWAQARDGLGQVVVLVGEAGIGKSRLVQTLKEHVAHDARAWLTPLQCSPYHQHSTLYPFVDLLERVALQSEREDSPEQRLHKLEGWLTQYGLPLAEVMPLFAALLSLPLDDRYAPLDLTPQQQRRKTLEALLAILGEIAVRQPVLLAVEDLHWADPTTLELLDLIVDQAPTTRLLALFSCRPEPALERSEGFVVPWAGRSRVTQVTLARLPQTETEVLVNRVAGGKSLPAEVTRQIVAKTDGVPLFVEELTKAVLESGLVQDVDGEYQLTGPLPPLAIPATLHDSLLARLDRLAAVKEVAQLAATIGREFAYDVLSASAGAAGVDETALRDGLARLVGAELIYQRGLPPRATYVFKHALVRDAAYASLLRSRRQQFHRLIAQTLVEQFPELVAQQPEVVAHHYTEAALPEQALPYWRQVGERALARSAYVEAEAHLRRAIDVLAALPETPGRAEQELGLQIALGNTLLAVKGFAAPAIGAAFTRAQELCRQIGDMSELLPVLSGLVQHYGVGAQHQIAGQLAEEFLDLARREDHPALVVAHWATGWNRLFLGELPAADDHFATAARMYDRHAHHGLAHRYGGDPGAISHGWAAWTRWLLGYPDQALRRMNEALALVQDLGHPYTSADVLSLAAYFHHWRREPDLILAHGQAGLAICAEYGFALWEGYTRIPLGWAMAQRQDALNGLTQIRRGLATVDATGSRVARGWFLGMLAEVCGAAGELDQALAALDEALAFVAETGERYALAEVHRLQGELLLQTAPGDHNRAEGCFHQALAVAREQQDKSLELRAATSLARLWRRQERRAEARDLLAPIYGWFTEGFDTADLQEARALLEALA